MVTLRTEAQLIQAILDGEGRLRVLSTSSGDREGIQAQQILTSRDLENAQAELNYLLGKTNEWIIQKIVGTTDGFLSNVLKSGGEWGRDVILIQVRNEDGTVTDMNQILQSSIFSSKTQLGFDIFKPTTTQQMISIIGFITANPRFQLDGFNREVVLQIAESFGRNDITIEQALSAYLSSVSDPTATKEDIEKIGAIDKDKLLQLNTNFDILLNQLIQLIDNGFEIANHLPHETDPIIIQDTKNKLDNLVNESIPNSINNVNNAISNFTSLGFSITQLQNDKYVTQLDRRSTLLSLIGGLIDESPSLKIIAGIRLGDIKSVVI